jgi:hypothetical protein
MENQIYRVNMESKVDLEFYVCGTSELNPYRETREIGIQLIIEEKQLDAGLDVNELNSFIDYLTKCRDYIIDYNSKSVPTETES